MTKPPSPLNPEQISLEEAARLFHKAARPPIRSMVRPTKALRQILRPMGKKFGAGIYELKLRWNHIAGESLSQVCTPEKLSGGKHGQTLTIRANGSAAMMIQAQSAQLLERINLIAGGHRVTGIRIVQGRIAGRKRTNRGPAQKKSCTSEQLAALDVQLSDISDPDLRMALKELGIGVLSKKQNQ